MSEYWLSTYVLTSPVTEDRFGQGAERTELLSPKQASLAEDFGQWAEKPTTTNSARKASFATGRVRFIFYSILELLVRVLLP